MSLSPTRSAAVVSAIVAMIVAGLTVLAPTTAQAVPPPPPAQVAGTLTYYLDGEPLEGFEVGYYGDNYIFYSAVTNAEGFYRIDVPPSLQLTYAGAYATPAAPRFAEGVGDYEELPPFEVEAGEVALRNLVVDPFGFEDGFARIAGTVHGDFGGGTLDSDTFGEILAVDSVTGGIDPESGGYGGWKGDTSVGPDVRSYSVDFLTAGSYKLEIAPASAFSSVAHQFAHGPAFADAEVFNAVSGEEISPVGIDLEASGTLEGVVEYSGPGLMPCTVRAFTDDASQPTRGAAVNEAGEFTLRGLSEASYSLAIWRCADARNPNEGDDFESEADNGIEYLYVGEGTAVRDAATPEVIDADFDAVIDLGTISLQEPAPAPSFSDVPPSHSFFTHITWLAEAGITSGFDDGTFKPSRSISRGQLAVFLYKLAGEPDFIPPEVSPFPDVSTSNQFFKHITWLQSEGIINGYADGRFGPGDPVTRGQFAVMLYKFDGDESFVAPGASPFPDVSTSNQFFPHIAWLDEKDLVSGYGDGTFRPGISLTRGQIAVVLYKYTVPVMR